MVILAEFSLTEEVFPSVVAIFDRARVFSRVTEESVNNDLRFIVAHISALANSRLNVDIVDSAAVHEDTLAFPIVRREQNWDGGGTNSSLRQVSEVEVGLIELSIYTSFNVGRGDSDLSLVFGLWSVHHLKKVEKRGVVDDTTHDSETTDSSEFPVFPDIACVKISPEVAHCLCHLNFATYLRTGHVHGIDGAGRDTGEDFPSEVGKVAVVDETVDDTGFPGTVGSTTAESQGTAVTVVASNSV